MPTAYYSGVITVPADNLQPLADALRDRAEGEWGSRGSEHLATREDPVSVIGAAFGDFTPLTDWGPDGRVEILVSAETRYIDLPTQVTAEYATARIECETDEDGGSRWLEVCTGGAARHIDGLTIFPGEPENLTFPPSFAVIAHQVIEAIPEAAEFKGLDGPDVMSEITATAVALHGVVPDFAYLPTVDDNGDFDGAAFGAIRRDGVYQVKNLPLHHLSARDGATGTAAVEGYLSVMLNAYRTVQPLR